jgi:hypothetical protein
MADGGGRRIDIKPQAYDPVLNPEYFEVCSPDG